jgi:L-fucose isomerase-like protein
MEAHFLYDIAASPLHERAAVERILRGFERLLSDAGGRRHDPEADDEAAESLPLFHVVLTGGTERIVIERLEEYEHSRGCEPAFLIAHPGHNSLPASLEILARVRRDGGSGQVIFISGPDDARASSLLAESARLAAVRMELARARIGAIGDPSDWLVASSQSAESVAVSWGPRLVSLSVDAVSETISEAVYETLEGASPDAALTVDFLQSACACREPTPADLARSSATTRALRTMVEEERLDALTIRCFELVTHDKATSCLALSRLADDGIPAGCEGDVPSIVAMLWLHRLLGQMPWMANPARIDPERGELLLAHCTVPRSLVHSYELRSHFESGLGVALQGELPAGPVTLVRLGGERLEEIWACEAQLIDSPHEEGLCRTQARLSVAREKLEELLEHPLGNHVILVPGHHERLLRASRELILGSRRS